MIGREMRGVASTSAGRGATRLKSLIAGRMPALSGQLPDRYADRWLDAFDVRVQPALVPGVRILDVGSGRRPSIPMEQRPVGCWYAGLDLSRSELENAPAGSYDEMQVGDVVRHLPELEGQFDLIVSWQVLEHVKPLDAALENLRSYLRPGGRLVAQFSGRFSAFGLINILVPQRVGVWALQRLLDRDPDTVFPAYYDKCWHGALVRILQPWSEREILSRHRGAVYFAFSKPLQSGYIVYEQWAIRRGKHNLATHYLINVRK